MARYDKDKVIGTGTFGYVWLVKSKLSRQSYVMKEINLNLLGGEEQQQALKEASILSKCKHENIIKYKESIVDQDKNMLSIVMEYAEGGDLHNAIVKQKGVPFKECRIISWFTQICLALQYIHYKNILHRDLKSQNIFLGRNKIIKLGDFGIARVLRGPDDLANTAVGTPYYLSPEVLQCKPYNHKSDMWALGCVLFEMVTLQYAFKADSFIHLVSLVRSGIRGKLPKDCNAFLQRLIDSLLTIDPKERPCTSEILADPILQPYLSEYLTTQNGKRNRNPIVTKKTSRRSSAGDIICKTKHTMKTNFSTTNMRTPKQRSTPLLKNTITMQTGQFVNSRPCSSKTVQKISILSTEKSGKEGTFKISKVGFALHMNQDYDFTRSCDAYVFHKSPRAENDKVSTFTKSEDFSFNLDYGYHTEEGWADDEMLNIDSDADCPSENMDSRNSPENVFTPDSEYLKVSRNEGFQRSPDGSERDPCPHTQCHQCMLDMLWDNRIRGDGGVVDTEERTRLKNKLLSIYKEKWFSKVYYYLASGWEGKDSMASKSRLQRMKSSLSYEQVQSLPLMMQLIQLDLLVKSQLN